MASDWPTLPLSDLTEPESPITYGVVKPGEEDAEGVLFIRGGDIANGRIRPPVHLRTITNEVSAQYQRTLLRGEEVLVSLVGNPGQVAIVPKNLRGANVARQVGVIRLRKDMDARFVMYFLASPQGQEALGARSLGSVQQVINLRDLKNVQVPVPPLSVQRAIANILGALDDKIELNRQTSETLESMARALFKSWFIDFDPVRAKAEGRYPPGMRADTERFFPSEFEDSAAGTVPRGWSTPRLGDVMELKRGYDLPSSSRVPGPIPIISSSGPSGWHNESKVAGPGVVTGRYGTIGQVFWAHGEFWPLNTTLYVKNTKGNSLLFVYYLLQQLDFSKYSDKAAVPGINRNHLHEEIVVLPPCHLQTVFEAIAGHWLGKTRHCSTESAALSEVRETLLPRLLAGQLEFNSFVNDDRLGRNVDGTP